MARGPPVHISAKEKLKLLLIIAFLLFLGGLWTILVEPKVSAEPMLKTTVQEDSLLALF